jgi:magnesium transporter
VLRILTLFGAIFLPLTFISGIFGMNVNFPGEGTSEAFWTIASAMIVTIIGLVGWFRLKRWL